MLKKITVIAMFGFFSASSLYGTLLDQAKWLLKAVERNHSEEVGCCVGNCLAASADFAIFMFGWMDLVFEDRLNRAHESRLKADSLTTTRKNLKKLIWFLTNVEMAFLYIEKEEFTPISLQRSFGRKFTLALNELRNLKESINETIKRIHLKNQAGDDRLKNIDISLDYYSTIRSTFCK